MTTRTAQALSAAQMFFYENAGYSYPTGTDPERGRIRCAILLERAENDYLGAHRVADVRIEWEHDADAAQDGEEFETCESATLRHGDEVLASLGGILDASDDYRREVRAELALEASEALQAIVKAAQ